MTTNGTLKVGRERGSTASNLVSSPGIGRERTIGRAGANASGHAAVARPPGPTHSGYRPHTQIRALRLSKRHCPDAGHRAPTPGGPRGAFASPGYVTHPVVRLSDPT